MSPVASSSGPTPCTTSWRQPCRGRSARSGATRSTSRSRGWPRGSPAPGGIRRWSSVQTWITGRYRVSFDGVALVQYRNERDSVGWHRDRELRWLDDTVIGVLTLGAHRPWLLKPLTGRRESAEDEDLANAIDLSPRGGDLAVMGGRTQADWLHAVPKVRGRAPPVGCRHSGAGRPSAARRTPTRASTHRGTSAADPEPPGVARWDSVARADRPSPWAVLCSRVHEAGAGAGHRGDHRSRARRPADAVADRVHRARPRQLLRARGRAWLRRRRPWPARAGRLGWAARPAARASVPLSRIHTVVITHSHPDHFGGAARLRGETGADILTHASFKLWWERGDGLDDRPSDALDDPDQWSRPTPWGTQFQPPTDGAISEMRDEMRSGDHTPHPTSGSRTPRSSCSAGREWVSMHTPGHTPDHLCLYDPTTAWCSRAITCCRRSPRTSARWTASPRIRWPSSSTPSTAWPRCPTSTSRSRARASVPRPRRAGQRDQGAPRRPPPAAARRIGRARPPGDRARADAAPLRRAGMGLDGRVGDVRPPRAPPPQPRGRRRAGPTACCATRSASRRIARGRVA